MPQDDGENRLYKNGQAAVCHPHRQQMLSQPYNSPLLLSSYRSQQNPAPSRRSASTSCLS